MIMDLLALSQVLIGLFRRAHKVTPMTLADARISRISWKTSKGAALVYSIRVLKIWLYDIWGSSRLGSG